MILFYNHQYEFQLTEIKQHISLSIIMLKVEPLRFQVLTRDYQLFKLMV
jgi:hypothetical protein